MIIRNIQIGGRFLPIFISLFARTEVSTNNNVLFAPFFGEKVGTLNLIKGTKTFKGTHQGKNYIVENVSLKNLRLSTNGFDRKKITLYSFSTLIGLGLITGGIIVSNLSDDDT